MPVGNKNKVVKYKKEEWPALADCIKTEQLSAKQVYETFAYNPEFAKWYRINYRIRKPD